MTVGELNSEIDPGPKVFEPDGVNDMQVQYDSILQSDILRIKGSPEGLVFGIPGLLLVDSDTGKLWLKTTGQEIATGWVEVGASAGVGNAGPFYGVGPPEGVQTGIQGSLYTNSNQEFWQKASAGTGNTGWVLMFG